MGSTHSSQIPVGPGGVTPLVAWLNRWRISAGLAVVGLCVTQGVIEREAPLNLLRPSSVVLGALLLIGVGVGLRVWALGTIDKNRVLTMTGVYSLCRHPLYLGSSLLFLGFALLMNDGEFLLLGVPYVLLFFGAAAFSEEHFLKSKFNGEFEVYRHLVPGFLPLGRWRGGGFSLSRAMRKGGAELIVAVVVLLAAVQWMAVRYG
ncbi:MAG: isoprenylcysteine carboxylmethyltransferase family protein [Phycisphaerales bacterium]